MKNSVIEKKLKIGNVVLIKGNERNLGRLENGVSEKLIKGRDGVVQAVHLTAGKQFVEHTIQHLYPVELSKRRKNNYIRTFRIVG